MADIIPQTLSENIGNGLIDFDTHSFKCCLLDNTYSASNTHSVYTAISTNELAAAGNYSVGGETLQNVTWTRSASTTRFDATDVTWVSASFTARYASIYDDTSAGKPLVCTKDFVTDKTVANGTFTLQFNALGILSVAPAA